jgi:hypothetical protein
MTVDSATTREANKQTLWRAVSGITALDTNPEASHAAIAKFADDVPAVSV